MRHSAATSLGIDSDITRGVVVVTLHKSADMIHVVKADTEP